MPEPGGLGELLPPPIFGISVNPIPGEGRLSPHITTATPKKFYLPASLQPITGQKTCQNFKAVMTLVKKNLQGRILIVLKYDLWYNRNLYDLGFIVFQLLILQMKAEFFKNSNFDGTFDFDWNSVGKSAEFTSFCNTANVLRRIDQSHSNHVSSWITRITSHPFGNLMI